MRAVLSFDLRDEREEFDTACKAMDYRLALYEVDQLLRAKVKYPEEGDTEDETAAYEAVRGWLREQCNERNLEL